MNNSLIIGALIVICVLHFSSCSSIYYRNTTTSSTGTTSEKIAKKKTPQKMEITASSSSEETKREKILRFAQQQMGAKYKYAGRDPKGFDCSGFTYYVLQKFDIEVTPNSAAQSVQGKKIKMSEVKTGDLIFFKRPEEKRIFHVAMVVNKDEGALNVIHSTTSKGVRIDNIMTSSYWRPKIYLARDVVSK